MSPAVVVGAGWSAGASAAWLEANPAAQNVTIAAMAPVALLLRMMRSPWQNESKRKSRIAIDCDLF
jgi:hypothetical protein